MSAIFAGIFYAFWSYREIISENYINKKISSHYRATILSVNSMLFSTAAIFTLPLLGKLTDTTNLTNVLLIIAIFAIISGLILFLIRDLSIKNYTN